MSAAPETVQRRSADSRRTMRWNGPAVSEEFVAAPDELEVLLDRAGQRQAPGDDPVPGVLGPPGVPGVSRRPGRRARRTRRAGPGPRRCAARGRGGRSPRTDVPGAHSWCQWSRHFSCRAARSANQGSAEWRGRTRVATRESTRSPCRASPVRAERSASLAGLPGFGDQPHGGRRRPRSAPGRRRVRRPCGRRPRTATGRAWGRRRAGRAPGAGRGRPGVRGAGDGAGSGAAARAGRAGPGRRRAGAGRRRGRRSRAPPSRPRRPARRVCRTASWALPGSSVSSSPSSRLAPEQVEHAGRPGLELQQLAAEVRGGVDAGAVQPLGHLHGLGARREGGHGVGGDQEGAAAVACRGEGGRRGDGGTACAAGAGDEDRTHVIRPSGRTRRASSARRGPGR